MSEDKESADTVDADARMSTPDLAALVKASPLGILAFDLEVDILTKPGRLMEIEFELIKTHAQAGYEILQGIEFPWPIAQIVRQHHERMDGSGYPSGLTGSDILLEARIMAVADTVEAMSLHRPYRPGKGLASALREIGARRGQCFDPGVVDACLEPFRGGFTLPA